MIGEPVFPGDEIVMVSVTQSPVEWSRTKVSPVAFAVLTTGSAKLKVYRKVIQCGKMRIVHVKLTVKSYLMRQMSVLHGQTV